MPEENIVEFMQGVMRLLLEKTESHAHMLNDTHKFSSKAHIFFCEVSKPEYVRNIISLVKHCSPELLILISMKIESKSGMTAIAKLAITLNI